MFAAANQSISTQQVPYFGKYGIVVKNDPDFPNTRLNITGGQARDSNNNLMMTLSSSLTILDATKKGANGLDSGSLQANSIYELFLIADSSGTFPTATLLSIESLINNPLIPAGYDSFRSLGYALTDSSAHFVRIYCSGVGVAGSRILTLGSVKATPIIGGSSTTYAVVDCSNIIPTIHNRETCRPVIFKSVFMPNAPGDTLSFQPGDGIDDAIVISAPVSGVPIIDYSMVNTTFTNNKMCINYKVSAGTVSIYVYAFIF